MALMVVEKRQALHHPRVQPVGRMPRHLAHDVKPVPQPPQLAACRRREDCDLAIFALIAVLGYVLAMLSETSCSVV